MLKWQKFMDMLYKEMTRREKDALRLIRREYEKVTTALVKDMGAIFAKATDGKLSYTDIVSYRKMQRLQQQAIAQANRLGKFNREKIDKLNQDSYEYSYSWMTFGIDKAVDEALEKVSPRTPELLEITGQNKMEKIRLTKAQEVSRAKITLGIQQAIRDGMVQGKNFQQMAHEIQKVFTMDYNRALTIAETEVHRNRERGTFDAATNADTQGIQMEKVWVNMRDERVRQTSKANHVVLQGQRRELNSPFDLGNDVQAMMPGGSNTPYNDIRCRCIARYEVVGIKQIPVAEGEASVKRQFKDWQERKQVS